MKAAVEFSRSAVTARLRQAVAGADLDPARRLDDKIGLSREAITRRLQEVAELNSLCERLEASSGGPPRSSP